jgi:DNA-binding SARP family transcriptional activator/class 3 adenylate cyclase
MALPSSKHGLEFILLGGFDVRLNGQPVTGFYYNKMRALLAYLAVEREQDHSREALAELLWAANDPITARGNLRRTLSHLRKAVELPSGITLFAVSKHSIRFIPNAYIDVMDFIGQASTSLDHHGAEQCHEERVIALYRGGFLAGLSMPDSPDFEGWLHVQREALHRRALVLLEQLASRYVQIGDYNKALQFALRHMELEPWDENAHCRLMNIYALNGQNSAAIRQYETCCIQLKNELGVLPCKETRQLYERIQNGEIQCGSTDSVVITRLPQTYVSPAERRQATVLYCELTADIVDDPDEVMELLCLPQARCETIIRQFSGHIVQTHGGGLLAYFGYPQAHEDAARRAVQAALALTREASHGIDIRAGIHTGLIITSGDPSMPDTVGKTSKLAIQLRHCTARNEVAISRQTHGIVGGYFDCISLGVQSLPDFAQPLEIFKVMQESGARTRLDAATQLTPMVGRKAEIDALIALWEKAEHGVRHVMLIQGEAGIGKSRLLHAIKERLADQPHLIRELRCFPEYTQSPFYPLIAMFEAVMGFNHYDTPEVKFGKVERYVETHYPESKQDAVPMLAQLLSLPLDKHYRSSEFSPQKQHELTCAILLATLEALSAMQPVLLIVEDVHWIDPSTLELLTLLVEQKEDGSIFAAFTARPGFVPCWDQALTSTLTLAPLTPEEVAEMIALLTVELPAADIHSIVERADGVPLFAEEMAKMAALSDHQASIPETLHDLLAARIDNMGETKCIAQLAATLGREFDLDVLRKISRCDPETLAHSLGSLQDAGLILPVHGTIYQFKHALIQEAAYQSQTKADRQAAHQRIAQALLSDFPDAVVTRPELLAQHLASGEETRQSVEYWIKAGQRAARNSANSEAIGHFNSGLRYLMRLPPDRERDRLEFELRISLGTALITAKGYGSVEAGQAYTRALELRECVDDNSCLFKALWGMWLTSSSRIGHTHSLELAEILLDLAQKDNDVLQLQLAHHAMGNSSFMTGNLNVARFHLERSMKLYRPSDHEAMRDQFGENICVSSGSLLSCVLWLFGFPEQAEETSRQTLSLARQVNHPHSLGYALCVAAIVNCWMKQQETTGLLAQEAIGLSQKHGFPLWLGFGSVFYGWALAMQGQAEGVVKAQQCLAAVDTIMSGVTILFLAPLCEALVHQRQFDKALDKLDEALHVIETKDSRFFESEFHRLKGECLLEISEANAEQAEACFSRALEVSYKQWSVSLELRAAISMARLWLRQDKLEEARLLLQDICNQFTEGFDRPDFQEAAQLLASLG